MSMDYFSWLHLTDFHYGLKGQDCLWPTLREPFLDSLEALHERCGPWHAVLFTGDLVQSGEAAQFEEMQAEVLDPLWRKLDELGSGDAVLLAVPGNHDLRRPDPDEDDPAAERLLDEDGFKRIEDKFWGLPQGSYRQVITRAFAAYDQWWEKAPHRATDVKAGALPGDFSVTLDCGNRRIGVVGLNTTFLQLGPGNYEDRLVWDPRQLQALCDGGVDVWTKQHDVCLLLTHQGPDWLTPEARKQGESEIAPAGRFALHLFGHQHETDLVYVQRGGARDAVRRCQGPSVFGMERFGDPPETQRAHGYVAGRVEFGKAEAVLRLWPRIATDKTGRWRFVPDHEHAELTDDEGTEPERVAARRRRASPARGPEKVDGLAQWLRHVQGENANLTAAFERRGAPQLLDHVYVELGLADPKLVRGLGDATEAAAVHSHKGALDRRRWTLEALLGLDPSCYPEGAITRRWLLFGDPGSGKTTLLRHLAWKLARRGGEPWVPVFASLPWLLREVKQQSTDYLDVLSSELQPVAVAPETLRRSFERLGDEGRLLWLFDGLAEVPADRRHQLDAILREAAARWPATPIVVTSRPIGGHHPDAGFRKLELLAFDDADRAEFLARWLGTGTDLAEDAARDALARLRQVPALWELAGNPLYLTLLAMLVEDGPELPVRCAQLYDWVFDFLLDGKHRSECTPIEPRPVVEDALRHLAWGMTEDGREAEQARELARRLWDDPRMRDALGNTAWSGRPQAFLDELAARTSILAQHDGRRRGWRFWHRTFREALVAQRLEEMLCDKGEEALLEHARQIEGDEGRWAEPWALLVGRLGPRSPVGPDALVKTLIKSHRALGLRALTTAQGLTEETIDEILLALPERVEGHETAQGWVAARGWEGWEARAEVYRRIPEWLGEADPALELLDRLRRRTSDGNDLFFIELAMVEVGRRSPKPEVGRKVERLRGQIFDHLAPSKDFAAVTTPVKSLWREIPAGSFLMGSSPSEDGSFDDERPQHEVIFSSPFEMAAVPVTNAQYRAFDPTHEPCAWEGVSKAALVNHPVVNVTWYEAVMFCRWLSGLHSGVRLSIEEEWEYACRGGTTSRFWSGDEEADLDRVDWYARNSGGRTHQVSGKPANPWGLYDMHGNVRERTQSPWPSDHSIHESGRRIDPSAVPAVSPADFVDGTTLGRGHVVRGGCFGFIAAGARSAFRDVDDPWNWDRNLGFRLVRPVRRPEP